ncbi:MAG: phosphatidate cytidylyltransferase [Planctomycetales bacterium]|nr:phosphatidate cytidylyltransferase [Planctomycetales bacterium]
MTPMERLFDPSQALADAVTLGMVLGISVVLVSASLIVRFLELVDLINSRTRRDLLARERAWYLIALAVVLPILAGAAWVCLALLLLALLCFREFARAAKLSESKTAMGSVVAATLLTFAAVIDHWQELFSASFVIGVAVITVSCLLVDQPHGYLRRIGLSLLGYFLFCASLAHLAYFSNGEHFRPILLWLLLCTELNDVFAFTWGKVLGHRKLMPNTSPNKTWGGALGAIVCTTLFAALGGHYVFGSTPLSHPIHLIAMGLLISVLGQLGDLLVSAIKRDLGLKDMSSVVQGHGGLLDRFDSLILVAPGIFYYVWFFFPGGVGVGQVERIFTSG